MATILSSKKSTHGSPYAYYTCEVTIKRRTPTKVTLVVKAIGWLQYSTSWLGTGSGYNLIAGIKIGGEWHTWTLKKSSTTWNGTTKHSASDEIEVDVGVATSAIAAKFRVRRGSGSSAELDETDCANIKIKNIAATYDDVAIAKVGNPTQAQASVKLSGLPSAVGYTRTIWWYNGATLIDTTSISSTSTTTSYTKKFSGLLPNTAYTLKAVVRNGTSASGTVLSTKSISIITPQETGSIAVTPQATYATIDITNMFAAPNYTRTVQLYYKKSDETDYVLFKSNTATGVKTTFVVPNLISNLAYDFKALIKNGNTILVTLNKRVETLTDTSLIPVAQISDITQQLGTRLCTIGWIASKDIAGTTYTVLAKSSGDELWTTLKTMATIESPVVVTAHAGNADITFKITSQNDEVVEGLVLESNGYELYVRDDFIWDSEKTAGSAFSITANEWNRLRDYAIEKNTAASILVVRQGDAITAETYNTMKNAISEVATINVDDKESGDAITAADIDVLRIAVNAG